MKSVQFDQDARAEFLAAVDYYEECQSGLGRRFRDLVENEVNNIDFMPSRFRVFRSPFRRCLIPNFPYYIIFSIESNLILVVAVAHAKRRPGYWLNRIKRYQ